MTIPGRWRRAGAAAALVALSLTLAACAGSSGSGSGTGSSPAAGGSHSPAAPPPSGPIKVGGIFTNTPFPFGADALKMAQTVFNQVNARGGIHGQKIAYVTGDDGGKPTTAAQLARQFASEGVVGMAGSSSFVDCGTNAGYYHQQGLLSIQGVGVDPNCYDSATIAPVTLSPYTQLTAMLYYASKYLHDTKICLFQPATPGAAQAIQQAINKWSGITGRHLLISDTTIPTNQTDYTPEVLRAKVAGCDAMFYGGLDTTMAAIMKTAQSQGMQKVDFLGLSISYTAQIAKATAGLGMKLYATTGLYPFTVHATQNAGWRSMAIAGNVNQTAFSEAGYASAEWMVSVLKSIKGPVTRAAVTKALQSGIPFSIPIIGAPLVFGPASSHEPNTSPDIMTLQGGTWKLVLTGLKLP